MARALKHLHGRPCRRRRHGRDGFTLLEILTVLIIIAVVMAIALPMLATARRTARKTRAAADLSAIETGLAAYKADFGDLPRFEGACAGFAMLGKAMFSPGPSGGAGIPQLKAGDMHGAGTFANVGTPGTPEYQEFVAFGTQQPGGGFSTTTAPPSPQHWAPFIVSDGLDGAGFRARPGGKTYPPYLQEKNFRLRGLAVLDAWDNPILYVPARPKKPAPMGPDQRWLFLQPGAAALYDCDQNISFFMRPGEDVQNGGNRITARKRMEGLLVQNSVTPYDGVIQSGETPATERDILLWTAGPDGIFGVTFAGPDPTKDEIAKADDITNFNAGQ